MAQFLYRTVEEDGNGDYTTLEACMNANEQDLTGDGWFDVEIMGTDLGGNGWDSADGTSVVIHNYTTTEDDYINIFTSASARHNGVYSSDYYRIEISADSTRAISIEEKYTSIIGLQISSTGASGVGVYFAAPANAYSIIVYSGGESFVTFTNFGVNLVPINTFNCIGIGRGDANRAVFRCQGANYDWYCYNCTGIKTGGGNAFERQSANLYTTNCYGATVSGSAFSGTITQITDASDDITAGGTDGDNIAYSTDNFVNVTGGSEDLHLVSGSALRGEGTDLSGTFTDDIDGDTRTVPWDIGVDEFVGAPAGWTHKIYGIANANIGKIYGIDKANIAKVSQI